MENDRHRPAKQDRVREDIYRERGGREIDTERDIEKENNKKGENLEWFSPIGIKQFAKNYLQPQSHLPALPRTSTIL